MDSPPHPFVPSAFLHLRASRLSGRDAFSLVEVTMALGIVLFALLTIVGLLPMGLTSLRDAMEQTVESQIVQRTSAEVLLTPYKQLAQTISGRTCYYDGEGYLLASSPAAAPAATQYWVTTTQADPVYPGTASLTDPATGIGSLSTIRIEVVRASSASAAVKSTRQYVILAPNSGN